VSADEPGADWFHEEYKGVSRLGLKLRRHLHSERSDFQNIDVYETEFFGRVLTLDGLIMFTERDEFVYHEMLVHVPLLSQPAPREVLIIGGGDCGCAREVLKHPSVERVVQCDIDERVTRVCEEYFEWTARVARDPRCELLFADGIEYVGEHENRFDLVIVDSTDPIGPAVGLFHRDFYAKVRRALRPGGVVSAQSESPHWDPPLVGRIRAELSSVFPKTSAYLGHIPTYPSGTWSWSYASVDRAHDDEFDEERAAKLEATTAYYNRELQTASFALPNFVREALEGKNRFARFGPQ
jgi:spermidine synthase